MKTPSQSLSLRSPRVRFNWGFHDGTGDAQLQRNRSTIPQGELFCLPEHDPVYSQAYQIGQAEFARLGSRPEDSIQGWHLYCQQFRTGGDSI